MREDCMEGRNTACLSREEIGGNMNRTGVTEKLDDTLQGIPSSITPSRSGRGGLMGEDSATPVSSHSPSSTPTEGIASESACDSPLGLWSISSSNGSTGEPATKQKASKCGNGTKAGFALAVDSLGEADDTVKANLLEHSATFAADPKLPEPPPRVSRSSFLGITPTAAPPHTAELGASMHSFWSQNQFPGFDPHPPQQAGHFRSLSTPERHPLAEVLPSTTPSWLMMPPAHNTHSPQDNVAMAFESPPLAERMVAPHPVGQPPSFLSRSNSICTGMRRSTPLLPHRAPSCPTSTEQDVIFDSAIRNHLKQDSGSIGNSRAGSSSSHPLMYSMTHSRGDTLRHNISPGYSHSPGSMCGMYVGPSDGVGMLAGGQREVMMRGSSMWQQRGDINETPTNNQPQHHIGAGRQHALYTTDEATMGNQALQRLSLRALADNRYADLITDLQNTALPSRISSLEQLYGSQSGSAASADVVLCAARCTQHARAVSMPNIPPASPDYDVEAAEDQDWPDLSSVPSKHMWVGNLMTRLQRSALTAVFNQYGCVEDVVCFPGRMYAFVNFKTVEDAIAAHKALDNTEVIELTGGNRKLVLKFRPSKKAIGKVREGSSSSVIACDVQTRAEGSLDAQRFSLVGKMGEWEDASVPSTRVWLGNIMAGVGAKHVRAAFTVFGELVDAAVFPGRIGPLGYAFVNFEKIDDAKAAYEALNNTVVPSLTGAKQLKMRFKPAKEFEDVKMVGKSMDDSSSSSGEQTGEVEHSCAAQGHRSRHLWLGNLTQKPAKTDIEAVFKVYGTLDSVRMFPGKTYAFVNFVDLHAAESAMDALDRTPVTSLTGSKPLVVRYQLDPEARDKKIHGRSASLGAGGLSDIDIGYPTPMPIGLSAGSRSYSMGAEPDSAFRALNLSNRLNPNNSHYDHGLALSYKRMSKPEKESLWAQDRALQEAIKKLQQGLPAQNGGSYLPPALGCSSISDAMMAAATADPSFPSDLLSSLIATNHVPAHVASALIAATTPAGSTANPSSRSSHAADALLQSAFGSATGAPTGMMSSPSNSASGLAHQDKIMAQRINLNWRDVSSGDLASTFSSAAPLHVSSVCLQPPAPPPSAFQSYNAPAFAAVSEGSSMWSYNAADGVPAGRIMQAALFQ